MEVINARNVSEALILGLNLIKAKGKEKESRNGKVLAVCPVTTVYSKPEERVLFYPERDANPFFHFFECLWMLHGRDDVEFVSRFNNQIHNYSDDGRTFHGAYGRRWRKHFDIDQLSIAIKRLKKNHDDRRVVIGMWDPWVDLDNNCKDVPCNTQIYLLVDDGKLNMTVCNRSNDMIWGAYGANAVHMSFLQEYIARCVGVKTGTYYQLSNNFHVYTESASSKVYDNCLSLLDRDIKDPYAQGGVEPYPILGPECSQASWDLDLDIFMKDPEMCDVATPFFQDVAKPLYLAYMSYRARLFTIAQSRVLRCQAGDWKKACCEWLDRREIAYRKRQAEKTRDQSGVV